MAIYNVAQANFLFGKGVKVLRVVEGKNGDMGLVFDRNDEKLNPLMAEWKRMVDENRRRKGLVIDK